MPPRAPDQGRPGAGRSGHGHPAEHPGHDGRKPGRIVLSHDCRHSDTIAAYAILLPWLKARYTLIPLPV